MAIAATPIQAPAAMSAMARCLTPADPVEPSLLPASRAFIATPFVAGCSSLLGGSVLCSPHPSWSDGQRPPSTQAPNLRDWLVDTPTTVGLMRLVVDCQPAVAPRTTRTCHADRSQLRRDTLLLIDHLQRLLLPFLVRWGGVAARRGIGAPHRAATARAHRREARAARDLPRSRSRAP